jgi:hypothetical protein
VTAAAVHGGTGGAPDRDGRSHCAWDRRYEPQGYDKQGREIIDLVPLNRDFPTLRIDADNPGRIVGKVVLHSRFL